MDITDLTLDPSSQDHKTNDSNESDDQGQLVQGEDEEGGLVVSSQGLSFDPSGQYHFRADTGQGQVTYRVVQVAQGDDGQTQVIANPQIVQTEEGIQVLNTTLQANPQVTQLLSSIKKESRPPTPKRTVIQSPFTNNGGNSPSSGDPLTGDGRFTYITAGEGGAATAAAMQSADNQALGQVAGGGQFYVMMSPQDVLQAAGPRVIAPAQRGVSTRVESNRTSRDERRRASHNEVERRRRDKMNEWIVHLSKMVPDCAQDNNKMMKAGSKGGILAKACEYISELQSANSRMAETIKESEKLSVDNGLLRNQVEELKQENAILQAQLQQHGIVLATGDNDGR